MIINKLHIKQFSFVVILLLLTACKKDKLEGEFEILQGKWQYIGSREARENKVTGDKTYSFLPASQFSDNYFLEFEHKGILTIWKNESEEKIYRLETALAKDGCTVVSNCKQRVLYLNFDQDKQFTIFLNEDTLYTGGSDINIPLDNYQDNIATYSYLHIYKRIN